MPVSGIPREIVDNVTHRARLGDDPLRIRAPDRRRDVRDFNPVATAVDAALRGLDPASRACISLSLRRAMKDENLGPVDRPSDVDAVLARLLAHLGIDPLAVAWLARVAYGAVVAVNHPSGFSTPLALLTQGLGAGFEFHRPVCWQPDGIVTLTMRSDRHPDGHARMPDTVATAAVGGPLSAVVSHPVLDDLALTVHFVERDDFVATAPRLMFGTGAPPMTDMPLLMELSGRLHERASG